MIFSYPPNPDNHHHYSKCPSATSYRIQQKSLMPLLLPFGFTHAVSIFPVHVISYFSWPWHHCNPTIYQSHSCDKSIPMYSTQEPLYFQNYILNPALQLSGPLHTRSTRGQWSSFLFKWTGWLSWAVLPFTGLETARVVHPCLPIQAGIQATPVLVASFSYVSLSGSEVHWMLPTLWQAWCSFTRNCSPLTVTWLALLTSHRQKAMIGNLSNKISILCDKLKLSIVYYYFKILPFKNKKNSITQKP